MPLCTWKSNVSSQLKTRTKRPSWWPRAFTDSVFPVPAGPRWKTNSVDCFISKPVIYLKSKSPFCVCATKKGFLTKWWPSKTGLQSLGHGEIAAVCQRGLDKLVLDTQVLKAIVELGIGHLNRQLLQDICLLGVKIEAHLAEPLKGLGVVDLVLDQSPGHITLVHQLSDLRWRKRGISDTLQWTTCF